MDLKNILPTLGISATGLTAERLKMGLVAGNLAHARDTDAGDGRPYARKEAVFGMILEGELAGGVKVVDVVDDEHSEFNRVYLPNHMHADDKGFVAFPNVDPASEMVDLIISSRAYEANLQVMRSALQMAEQALEIGR